MSNVNNQIDVIDYIDLVWLFYNPSISSAHILKNIFSK